MDAMVRFIGKTAPGMLPCVSQCPDALARVTRFLKVQHTHNLSHFASCRAACRWNLAGTLRFELSVP
jgi:hypothetical protein